MLLKNSYINPYCASAANLCLLSMALTDIELAGNYVSVKRGSNRHRFSEGLSLIRTDLAGNLCLLSVAPIDIDLARVL